MSRSVNKVTLVGNLGNDPEIRSTNSGTKVATFSLATTESWTGQGGEKQEKTEWHRCVVWNKLAEVVEKYVKKGDRLYVEGKIEYRQWTDKDGQTRYSTEIKIRDLVMLGGGGGRNGGDGGEPRGRSNSGGGGRGKAQAQAARAQQSDDSYDDFPAGDSGDDDLPF